MENTRHPGIYRRGTKYVGVISYKDGAGKRRQKWITRRTLAAVLDARRKLLDELDRGVRPDGARITLGEFLEGQWLPHAQETCRPLTYTSYVSIVKTHVLEALGPVRLRDVGWEQLQALYRPLTPTTKLRVHRTLSAAFTYAVKELHLLAANPCASVVTPRRSEKRARWLEEKEARRMLGECRGDPLEGAILLGLVGGLRIAEVCGIRWRHIEDGTLTVGGSFHGPTKNGKVRRLTLPATTLQALRRYRAEQAERLLALGIRQTDETTVVTAPLGGQMHPVTLSTRFRSFCSERGFDITFHGLRHTCASLMLSSGTDVRTAAERLGHAKPGILLEVYAHAIKSADEAAAERLGKVLEG
jgi:integrase